MENLPSAAYPGLFVTLEGGEGSGKTTLLNELAARLEAHTPITRTGEPGRSGIGPTLRALILNNDTTPLTPETEALLLAADRAQHVNDIIRPALANGHTVLCDRYADSSIAYQGIARGLGHQRIADLNEWATRQLVPDLTILLDINPEDGLARRYAAGNLNRLDQEEIDFHRAVRAAYLALADQHRPRFLVLPAHNSTSTNAHLASQEILKRLHLKHAEAQDHNPAQ